MKTICTCQGLFSPPPDDLRPRRDRPCSAQPIGKRDALRHDELPDALAAQATGRGELVEGEGTHGAYFVLGGCGVGIQWEKSESSLTLDQH